MSKTDKEVQQRELANFAIGLGFLGLIAWFIPIVGIPIAAVAIILAVKGIKFDRAKVALVLAIISLVASVINATLGAVQGYYGTHTSTIPQIQVVERVPGFDHPPIE